MKQEGKLGEHGTYSAEITPDGKLKANIGVEYDVIVELRKLAKSTENELDDALVDKVEAALGRS